MPPGRRSGSRPTRSLAEFCEPSREDVDYYKRARRAGATDKECLEFAETDRGLRVLHEARASGVPVVRLIHADCGTRRLLRLR